MCWLVRLSFRLHGVMLVTHVRTQFKEDICYAMKTVMYVMLYRWILNHTVVPEEGNNFLWLQYCFPVLQVLRVLCVMLPESITDSGRVGSAVEGTYASVFDFCAGRCRHNSESVVHENAYFSDFHHCFSLPSNGSGSVDAISEERLAGINVFVGRQGESCDSTCKSRGQSCVTNKLLELNQCESMKKFMSCKGGCLASIGPDQPAEVVEDAPKHLYPRACLYTKTKKMFTCDGFHQHTRRLCPCT